MQHSQYDVSVADHAPNYIGYRRRPRVLMPYRATMKAAAARTTVAAPAPAEPVPATPANADRRLICEEEEEGPALPPFPARMRNGRYTVYRVGDGVFRTVCHRVQFVKMGPNGSTAIYYSPTEKVYIKTGLSPDGSCDIRHEATANKLVHGCPYIAEVVYVGNNGPVESLVTRALGPQWFQVARSDSTVQAMDDAKLADSIMAALSDIHARGAIHGDAHAGNIFANEAHEVRFIDLGYALFESEFYKDCEWLKNPYFLGALEHVTKRAPGTADVCMVRFMQEFDRLYSLVSCLHGKKGLWQYLRYHGLPASKVASVPVPSHKDFHTCFPVILAVMRGA